MASSFWEDYFWKDMHNMHEEKNQEREEFKRLLSDRPSTVPQVGSRVLVAAGFLGMGHIWIREEGVVEECGDTSYKIRFINYTPYSKEKGSLSQWVHQSLITDVLKGEKQ